MEPIFFYTQKTSVIKYGLFHLFIAFVLLNFLPKTCLADGKRIFDENKSSVVIIYAYDRNGNQINQASGFIAGKDGPVVTNYRIVSNASEIKIKAEDTMLNVKGLLYIDRGNDIAILKTEDNNFPAVKIHDLDIGPEGQKIFMIGSPQGEAKILFDGTLSRIMDITREKKLLLITAPVTKGCSGSPVFNENGEVIGIATFFIEEAQAFYFAMPVAQIKNKLSLKIITPLDKAELVASGETSEYWFNLGLAYESLGLYSSASGAYQESIRLNPEDAIAHNNLGVVYTNLDIYSFAIREHQEAIRLNSDYQEAYYNLGIAYTKSDMDQKAIETFGKAITLKPDDAKSHNNLAYAYFKSGKSKEAIEASKQAIRIKPDYPEAYYNLGVAYYHMQMNKDAIEALKQSIRMNPDIPEAHFGLGVIYSMQDMASALKEYEILKNLDPSGANALHEIIEATKAVSSPDAEKEKITQPETTDAFVKELIPSDKIDKPAGTSEPEIPRKSKQVLNKEMYSVQVSVFESEKNAHSLTKRLRDKGYDTFLITEYRIKQSTRYRVLVGKFTKKDEALKTADIILEKEGMKSVLFKH